MSATSAEVARLAGVSRATVSQVLNGHSDRFAPETADKVLAAASELEYRPSAAGRALRKGSSDFVLALIPNTTFGSNLQELFESMTEDLAEHGLTLVLRLSSSTTASLNDIIMSVKPAAVIALAPFTEAEREVLDRHKVLSIDPPSVSQIDYNRAIGELQVHTLIERGYTRLAYARLHDSRQDPYGYAREEGVRAVAAERGLTIQAVQTDITPESALAALDSLSLPVAIACYNDDVALAMLFAARSRGLAVPRDVAVIGMDHTALSRVSIPTLATIHYDLVAAAQHATAGLLRSLGAGAVTPNLAPAELTLIVGDSI